MALNPDYVLGPSLQEYFVDKLTGLPLSGGIVTFYSDTDRSLLKDVFEIGGTPPNYTYNVLPNPLTLSSVGTIQDLSGNDVLPYYFPFDAAGNTENYYITVTDSGGNLQFTREGIPNSTGGSTGTPGSYANLIPNGQFLIHTNVVTSTTTAGLISQADTIIGAGGWSFNRPSMSAAKDIVTFERFGFVTTPTGNPRWKVRIKDQIPAPGDTFKDLRVKFDDVNKFANATLGSEPYRFAFSGQSNSSGSLTVSLVLIKNYGTGTNSPSATTETTIGTFVIPNTAFVMNQVSFNFGSNSGKTFGNDNNSYLQLAIRFPTDNLFDVSLTDFILIPDTGTITNFPNTPDSDFRARGVAGWMPTPNPDGSDLYLVTRLTAAGMIFDHGEIGQVIQEANQVNYTSSISTTTNNLLCDGATYLTSGYSPLGIPYSRLQQYLFSSSLNMPIFGTGPTYLTSYTESTSGSMIVTVNAAGAQTAATDGAVMTNFTFNEIHHGEAAFGFTGYAVTALAAAEIYVLGSAVGSVTAAIDVNSGFTIAQLRNSSAVRQLFSVITIAASAMTAGHYFTFTSPTPTSYYMWFKINGVGADPAPGGTGIEVDLLSTHSAQDVANIVAQAFSGLHMDNIIIGAGSTIAASSYFNLTANSVNYYVWYTVQGVGTDPAIAGKTPIPVSILTADTAAQVVTKTQTAINSLNFAVPDFRGVFFRGYDPTHKWDLDYQQRWSFTTALYGAALGTFEFDSVLQHLHANALGGGSHSHSITDPGHLHTYVTFTSDNTGQSGGSSFFITASTVNTGGAFTGINSTNAAGAGVTISNENFGTAENRPINAYVNYAIKY